MEYLIFAIAAWVAGLVWFWWAAKHAPEMDDNEETHPPRREEDT